MAIRLGKYSFEGSVASIDKLRDKAGVYAVICKVDNEYFLVDIGESSKLRTRIENRSDGKMEAAFHAIKAKIMQPRKSKNG